MTQRKKRVLLAEDESALRRLLEYNLRKSGLDLLVAINGRDAIKMGVEGLDCALVDLKMPHVDGMEVLEHFREHLPEVPIIIMSAVGQLQDAVLAIKKGALNYVAKPFDIEELVALVHSAANMGQAMQTARQIRNSINLPMIDSSHVVESQASRNLLETVREVAFLDFPVLLTGERGVGKRFLARAIHLASKRAGGPFIMTSCPSLPSELLESEVFGHERGTFTDAPEQRPGRIELAEGGTLFLDEIGDLPPLLQPKLLHLLHENQFMRLGGSSPIDANVRVIASTTCDLQQRVDNQEFSEELFLEFNAFPVHIPPLRERPEDLPPLCRQILDRICKPRKQQNLELGEDALALLAGHSWPGNVRELENVLERASMLCEGDVIEARHLVPGIRRTLE